MPEFRQLSFELPEFVATTVAPARARTGMVAAIATRDTPRSPDVPAIQPLGGGKSHDHALSSDCRDWLRAIGGMLPLMEKVEVCWNNRLATTAGLAYHREARIELNPRLREFAPDEPLRTLKHELAHLIAHQRAGRRRIQPHGVEWRRACTELGISGEDRCHTLPFARRQLRKKFAYRCRHCRTVVPRVRPMGRDSACYPCCRAHNGGQFDRRYLLERIPLDVARQLSPDTAWG